MAALGGDDWTQLPQHIMVNIFSYLPQSHRAQAAQVCRAWNDAFNSPYLWQDYHFRFYNEDDAKSLECVRQYGTCLKTVLIELDQHDAHNRENSLQVLSILTRAKERRLQNIKIVFSGENPYFYAGKEFLDALNDFFHVPETVKIVNTLKDIDLGSLTVSFDDSLLDTISATQPDLERLNIQNKVLICKVSATSVLRLLQRCRKLKELRLFYCSMSEDILLSLTETDRTPMKMLALKCRRDEKYGKDLEDSLWESVSKALPRLRVCLTFDHTCPLHKVTEIMKPHIPVSILKLETFTYIYDEVRLATSYYSKMLEELVLQTPLSRNSPELNGALVDLAKCCPLLEKMHVYCVLDDKTVKDILDARPIMRQKGTFTLKYKDEPHPWKMGPTECNPLL